MTAAVLLSAAVASPAAASTAVGPSTVQAVASNAFIGCTGDTVSGTVRLVAPEPVQVVAVLLVRHHEQTFVRTDRTVTFTASPGTTGYSFGINAAGLPLTVTAYKVDVSAGTGTATSNAIPVGRCAPAAVVPEVPSVVLLPLSLALTGGVVLRVRRRDDRA